jgi:hypothetical protein
MMSTVKILKNIVTPNLLNLQMPIVTISIAFQYHLSQALNHLTATLSTNNNILKLMRISSPQDLQYIDDVDWDNVE